MIFNSEPINLYHKYRQEKGSPFLLESLGPQTPYSSRSILAANHKRKLVCLNGDLIEDGRVIGSAENIFQYLKLPAGPNFFPAWMGFFSYEFARNLRLPSKTLASDFPEAVFFYFDEGFLWDGQDLVEGALPIKDSEQKVAILDSKSIHPVAASGGSGFSQVARSILRGDVYQVNLAQRFSFDAKEIDFFDLYQRLRLSNPSPFMGLIEDRDWAIACASPERLFRLCDGNISSRPIAGTRKRGLTETEDEVLEIELLETPKERAEHAMLVDLARNDLARVCETGSVCVDEAFIVERYSHVMHLVSEISGRSSASLHEIFRSLFPAGTITGTPKEAAMQHIRDLEPFERGAYTGSMGYVSGRDGADFNILIRSAFRHGDDGHIWAGAGIVAQSDEQHEDREMASKAQSVSNVLSGAKSPSTAKPPRTGVSFTASAISKRFENRVLFIENHDSFSHNIIDAVRKLGCIVDVVDHQEPVSLHGYRHVIFGPGPKNPVESGNLLEWLNEAIVKDCAILGICLGHQALGHHFGAKIIKARRAIHGEVEHLVHIDHPLFNGVPASFKAMRYHSLVLTQIPSCFEVIAHSLGDEVMAIAHKERPWFGVQFHPESFLSEGGDQLMANFFELAND